MPRNGVTVDTSHFRASIPVAIRESREESVLMVEHRLVDRLLHFAEELCPVHSGRLKASLHRTPLEEVFPNHYSAEVADGVPYGVDVEFGRHPGRQRTTPEGSPAFARPFMRPAATLVEAEWSL